MKGFSQRHTRDIRSKPIVKSGKSKLSIFSPQKWPIRKLRRNNIWKTWDNSARADTTAKLSSDLATSQSEDIAPRVPNFALMPTEMADSDESRAVVFARTRAFWWCFWFWLTNRPSSWLKYRNNYSLRVTQCISSFTQLLLAVGFCLIPRLCPIYGTQGLLLSKGDLEKRSPSLWHTILCVLYALATSTIPIRTISTISTFSTRTGSNISSLPAHSIQWCDAQSRPCNA